MLGLLGLLGFVSSGPWVVRVRRQAGLGDFGPPRAYRNPGVFNDPFPGRDASSIFPQFPFVATGNGAASYSVPSDFFKGFLDIPIMGWNGIFDIKGSLLTGVSNTEVGVGYLVNPTNLLDINPAAASAVAANPLFQTARRDVGAIPVARLPAGFTPLSCKPPFCNPYLGNIGVGVQIEPGDDRVIDGDLEFPVPTWSPGGGVRLPIAYGLEVGSTPYKFSYGHGIGPTDFLQKDYDNRRAHEERIALLNATPPPLPPAQSKSSHPAPQYPNCHYSILDERGGVGGVLEGAWNEGPLPRLPDFGALEGAKESRGPVTAEEFLRHARLLQPRQRRRR